METLEEKLKQIHLSQNMDFNIQHNVVVTHINDPHDFYVRLVKYSPVIREIEKLNVFVRPETVKLDQIIIFSVSKGSKFARGRISSVSDSGNTFDIFTLDYGFIDKGVHIDHIWECCGQLLSTPPLALNCALCFCARREDTWTQAIEVFKSEAEGYVGKMFIEGQSSKQLIVSLFVKGPTDVSGHLALLDLTLLCGLQDAPGLEKNNGVETKVKPAYKFKDLKVNVPIHVRVLSGKTLEEFYVAEVYDHREYLDTRENITMFSKREPFAQDDGEIKSGDVVTVRQFLTGYARGIVKEVLDSKRVLIHLVDEGKSEVVPVGILKRMPAQCMKMPVVAMHCLCRTKVTKDLRLVLHPGNDFIIEIKELGHGFDTPHIVEIK